MGVPLLSVDILGQKRPKGYILKGPFWAKFFCKLWDIWVSCWFWMIFVGFRVLTAPSSELPQVCQNGPKGHYGDQKQLCLMKKSLYYIIFVIWNRIAAFCYFICLDRKIMEWSAFFINHGSLCRHFGHFCETEATLKKLLLGLRIQQSTKKQPETQMCHSNKLRTSAKINFTSHPRFFPVLLGHTVKETFPPYLP